MKKIIALAAFLTLVLTLAACTRAVSDVQSIELSWTPDTWYDVADEVTLGDKEITVRYNDGTSDLVQLNNPGVSLSGSGVDGLTLVTDVIGEYEVIVEFEGSSLSFTYYVDDQDLVAELNAESASYFNTNGLIDNNLLERLNLEEYLAFHDGDGNWSNNGASMSGWSTDIYNARMALPGGVFANALEARQIFDEAIFHRTLTADGRAFALELKEEVDNLEFENFNFDRFMLNLLSLYEESTVPAYRGGGNPDTLVLDDGTEVSTNLIENLVVSFGDMYDEYSQIDEAVLAQALYNAGESVNWNFSGYSGMLFGFIAELDTLLDD